MSRLPKELSEGEETLDLHLRANGIKFKREVCLIPGKKWRYDFVLLDFHLAIEVHGAIWQKGKHARGDGLERDYAKINAAVLAGYAVLQYSTAQVTRGDAIRDIVQLAAADALGALLSPKQEGVVVQ